MLVTESFHGFIETTQDVLLIFEGCRRGLLPRICRRLQERERKMIRSGSVFVFDQRESGIKRWTDGRVWSPSRILGNFLIYRELDKRSPGDKKMSISSASSMGSMDERRYSYSMESVNASTTAATTDMPSSSLSSSSPTAGSVDRNRDRQLVGSLSDTYKFRQDGLIKKTMSIVVNGVSQHLISYYDPRDVLQQKLRTPSSVPELASLEISPELLVKQNFRIPPMVEPTFDHNDSLSSNGGGDVEGGGGSLSPPDSLSGSLDRRMHPFRSMSLGSVRPEHPLATSHGVYPYQHPQQQHHHHHHHHHQQLDSTKQEQSPTLATFVQPPLPVPTNLYNAYSAVPSPTSMSSSPSTPMLSPARSSFQHQRHFSTSSASSSSLSSSVPRYDPRHYSTDYSTSPSDRMHQQHQQHTGQIQLMPDGYDHSHHDQQQQQQQQQQQHAHCHPQQQQQQQHAANLGQLLNPVHPLQDDSTQPHPNTLLQSMSLAHSSHQPGTFADYGSGYNDKEAFALAPQDGNNGTSGSGFMSMQRYPMTNQHSTSPMDSLYTQDASGSGLHSSF